MRTSLFLLLLALPAVPRSASAQSLEDYDYENLAFRGVGVEVGQILPARVEGTLLLGVRADLGYLGPNVRILPGITFWSSALREGEVDDLRDNILELCRESGSDCVRELGEIRVSDLALALDGHYTFPGDWAIAPYLGAGIALHLLNGRGDLINGTFVEDLLDAISPGVNLIGGVEVPLGSSLRIFAEARGVLASDVQHAGLSLGASWLFPRPTAQTVPGTRGSR
ncbi:MAG TPA: hypothetical protein VHG28_24990 [Longimicrobiaceae bacterium]|nr:hypothetical protein [Longimicrobiaceae bacterium]